MPALLYLFAGRKMNDLLAQYLEAAKTAEEKLNRLREFLQLTILKIMYDRGILAHLAFVGGTALRIIFNLRRFSEDMNFLLIERKTHNFPKIVSSIENDLGLYGLHAQFTMKSERTAQNVFFKFSGLLKETGLSALSSQNISIKLEIDINPPLGASIESTLVNRLYVLNLRHFDLPSSFATKLCACFFRKYIKGRDFYDLLWYLTKNVRPNIPLFNNAVKQIKGEDLGLNEEKIKEFILGRIREIDFALVVKDAEKFLEDKAELKLLNSATISQGVEQVFR
jgi:predicted nucleotidyltransferase component of viral defense system